jgi:hypothetical protein
MLGGAGPAAAPPAPCQSWSGVPPPSPGNDGNFLLGVTVLSACNAWAAGDDTDQTSGTATLIEHWDGGSWTVVPSPNIGGVFSALGSISAASATSIWAVGTFLDGHSTFQPVVLHWNGLRWSQQTVPPVSGGSLNGVRAVSASDVWAVGSAGGGAALILHWDGSGWKRVPSPDPGSGASDDLLGVAATAHNDAWAVGERFVFPPATAAGRASAAGRGPVPPPGAGFPGAAWHPARAAASGDTTLIMHWNGSAWQRVPSPRLAAMGTLMSVAASSAGNAWAVGSAPSSQGDTTTTLTLHWNGSAWSQVPTPGPSASGSALAGVAVTSASNAWAVGFVNSDTGGQQALLLHWNGSGWATAATPGAAGAVGLSAVAAQSAGNAWAVGFSGGSPPQAAAIHCC